MLNMTRDEQLPVRGALELFKAIPGSKRVVAHPRTHVEISGEAIDPVGLVRRELTG